MARMESLRTDPKKRNEGVWQLFYQAQIDGDKDMHIKLASMQNKDFLAHAARLYKPHVRRLQIVGPDTVREKSSDDEWWNLVLPAVAKHLIKDWRGFEADDEKTGKRVDVPFSQQKALEWLRDENLPFGTTVQRLMSTEDVFRIEQLEIAKGECAALSDGGSSTDGASN